MNSGNCIIFGPTDHEELAHRLRNLGERSPFHVTNTTGNYPEDVIVPRVLAGFRWIEDNLAARDSTGIFLVAVNSDISMEHIATKTDVPCPDSQLARLMNITIPLSLQFPGREIAGVFYDEETPAELYKTLAGEGLDLASLHKHGYATGLGAPKIEGAEYFMNAIGFALPGGQPQPVCLDITQRQDQSRMVKVHNLFEEEGPHGAPYLSPQGRVLFPLIKQLQRFQQKTPNTTEAAPPSGGGRRFNI
jgi:hypothetical protein